MKSSYSGSRSFLESSVLWVKSKSTIPPTIHPSVRPSIHRSIQSIHLLSHPLIPIIQQSCHILPPITQAKLETVPPMEETSLLEELNKDLPPGCRVGMPRGKCTDWPKYTVPCFNSESDWLTTVQTYWHHVHLPWHALTIPFGSFWCRSAEQPQIRKSEYVIYMDVLVGQSWIEDFLNDSSKLNFCILSPFPEAKVAERVWKSTASWTEHTSAVIGRCKRANCQGDEGSWVKCH